MKPASRCCNDRYTVAGSVACSPTRSPATSSTLLAGAARWWRASNRRRRAATSKWRHCVPRPRRPSVAARSLALARSHQCRPPSTKSAIAAASSTGMSPCTLCPASAKRSTRRVREAAQQLGLVGVVDDRLGAHPAGEHHRDVDAAERRPTAAPSRRSRIVGESVRRRGVVVAAVAPAPRPVVELLGVVQDAAAQRRLGARRVVLDRPGEDLVEAGERRRAADEVGDRLGLVAVDARRDVDEHEAAHELGTARRRGRSPSARRATCRRRPRRRERARRSPRRRRRRATRRDACAVPAPAASEWPWPGRSTATSGRSRARATVSQVWAFCAPPWISTSSGGAAPHTRALIRRDGPTSTNALRTSGGPVVGDAELGGVVGEVGELVVRHPCGRTASSSCRGRREVGGDVGDRRWRRSARWRFG